MAESNPFNALLSGNTNTPEEIVRKTDTIIKTVFCFTIDKNAANSTNPGKPAEQLVYLEELAVAETPKTLIDVDLLEQALFERLLLPDPSATVIPANSSNPNQHAVEKNVLCYLAMAMERTLPFSGSKDLIDFKVAKKMKHLILRNAATALKQPELFDGQNLSEQLYNLFKDIDGPSHNFISDVVKNILDDGDFDTLNQLKVVFKPVLMLIYEDISKASLVSLDLYVFPTLMFFAASPFLALILLDVCTPTKPFGRGYQDTILGSLLGLSALPKSVTDKYEYFDSPLDVAANTLTEGRLWASLSRLAENLHTLFLTLLKCNPDIKKCTLKWISGCLNTNSARGKLWNAHMPDLNPEALTLVSDGFMINLSSLLLRLCQPFCSSKNINKCLKVDPTYCAVEDKNRASKGVSMRNLDKETCIVPPREVTDGPNAPPRPTARVYSFITECFFMTHRALDLGYRVAVDKCSVLGQDLNRAHRAYNDAVAAGGGNIAEALQKRIHKDIVKFTTFRCVLFEPEFITLAESLHAATSNWLVQVAIHPIFTEPAETLAPLTPMVLSFPITIDVPDTLRCVPEFVVENVIKFISSLRKYNTGFLESKCLTLLKASLSLVLVFMGSAERMKNPHQRACLAECLEALLPEGSDDNMNSNSRVSSYCREQLFKEHPHRLQIIPSLLDVFVGIEVTGQSVQFEQKFNYRRPMYLVMEYLWGIEEHRECFKLLSDETEKNMEAVTPPLFLRFVNLLMNDAVFLLDEALSNMAQIRNLQAIRESSDWENLPAQEREQNVANLHTAGMTARYDNILGQDTIRCLERLTGYVKSVFCHSTMVDRIASMLNYFLLNLVGPNKKNFKVKDSKEYQFKPAVTVLHICRMYVNLSESDEFCLAVSQDGRSYSPQLFNLAEDVLIRIQGGELIGSLQIVAEKVAKLAQQKKEDDEALVDAPEEFLDPIMSTLMLDPVILPSSRTTVDRTTIARHLLSDQSDPFNRSPLSMDLVKSNEELKNKIQQWITSRRKNAKKA